MPAPDPNRRGRGREPQPLARTLRLGRRGARIARAAGWAVGLAQERTRVRQHTLALRSQAECCGRSPLDRQKRKKGRPPPAPALYLPAPLYAPARLTVDPRLGPTWGLAAAGASPSARTTRRAPGSVGEEGRGRGGGKRVRVECRRRRVFLLSQTPPSARGRRRSRTVAPPHSGGRPIDRPAPRGEWDGGQLARQRCAESAGAS